MHKCGECDACEMNRERERGAGNMLISGERVRERERERRKKYGW